uniref:Uncharacterized protein n=1 Tax=Clonostachys rogersoniana TaxID=122658 RepID=A0A8F1Y3U0_CLORO|nr:hypothetical protein [Clonostachys rogersoniana]
MRENIKLINDTTCIVNIANINSYNETVTASKSLACLFSNSNAYKNKFNLFNLIQFYVYDIECTHINLKNAAINIVTFKGEDFILEDDTFIELLSEIKNSEAEPIIIEMKIRL